MIEGIDQLIAQARRELRIASGIPLTPQEKAEEDRRREIGEMQMFVYKKFGIRLMAPFKEDTIWTQQGAAAEFRAGGKRFLLRKTGPNFRLSVVDSDIEHGLVVIQHSDPQFVNKVLVAIGDSIGASQV